MNKPAVSVIIPTFNRPAFLGEAVRSVLAQTSPAREIIIVDNGSDRRFQPLIGDIARLDDHISLYTLSSNRGASSARNFGLEKARGDYLLFLDDDDLLHPHMLRASLEVFGRTPGAAIVTCLSRAFIDHSSPESPVLFDRGEGHFNVPGITYPLNHPDYLNLERVTFSTLLHHTLVIHSCLVRKECMGDIRFPEDLRAGEDTYFWLRLAAQGHSIILLRKFFAYVRFHSGSSRSGAGYDEAAILFFLKLLSSGMLRGRHDYFLAHAHLALKLLRMKRFGMLRHLLPALRSPDLALRYLWSYHRKGARRMRLLYHFLEKSRDPLYESKGDIPELTDYETILEKVNTQ